MDRGITIRIGDNGRALTIQPGGDTALFYSDSPEEPRCIGHLRFDVDGCGKLWASWEPHSAARTHNRQPFRDEFDVLVNALQRKLFRDANGISKRLADMGVPIINEDRRYYGFHIDSDAYSYYFRVYPGRGDYSYCYCYAREGVTDMRNLDKNLLGERIVIRGVAHICIAQSADALLFLQMDEAGEPCQYVVAHSPYYHDCELCWLSGDYYPLWNHPDSIAVLANIMNEMAR